MDAQKTEILQMEDSDDISVMLKNWETINKLKKDIIINEERINNKIKAYLKERKWTTYKDEKSNINVVLTNNTRESFDKHLLKTMLSPEQYNMVCKITVFEKMLISTAEARDKIKKFLNKNKRVIVKK
jgi:hypothetical protein